MKFETKNGGISAVDGIPPGTLEMKHISVDGGIDYEVIHVRQLADDLFCLTAAHVDEPYPALFLLRVGGTEKGMTIQMMQVDQRLFREPLVPKDPEPQAAGPVMGKCYECGGDITADEDITDIDGERKFHTPCYIAYMVRQQCMDL